MKAYTYDLGYRGGLVVIAETLNHAHNLMFANFDEYRTNCDNAGNLMGDESIEEHDLENFSFEFFGDR